MRWLDRARRIVVARAREGDHLTAHVIDPPGCRARILAVVHYCGVRLLWVALGFVAGLIVGSG